MARITVEDCLEHVDNLFELVLVAAKRARRLANGAEAYVDWENDKPTVVALREIASGYVKRDILDEVDGPMLRHGSPPGLSTLMTSAPRPARIEPQRRPFSSVKSRTL